MVNSPCFFQVESDLRSSARNRQILLIPAYKEATSNLAQTSFVHAGSTAPQVRARRMLSNSQLVRDFTKHMPNELLPIDPIERFLTLKQAALCNKRFLPSLNIQIRRFPLQLPPFVSTFSSYTQSQTFPLITKKLMIQIRQIARSRHRNLKKTCEHGQRGFQILARGALSSWSGAFWRASRKAAF